MGYPFDRVGRQNANTLSKFMTPNMSRVDVSIQFYDRVITPNRAKNINFDELEKKSE
jgi:hypothetical protein